MIPFVIAVLKVAFSFLHRGCLVIQATLWGHVSLRTLRTQVNIGWFFTLALSARQIMCVLMDTMVLFGLMTVVGGASSKGDICLLDKLTP